MTLMRVFHYQILEEVNKSTTTPEGEASVAREVMEMVQIIITIKVFHGIITIKVFRIIITLMVFSDITIMIMVLSML